ncbi:MAG: hypothetical protein U9N58_05960 [Thermodesulfobacteriota bacterium]|nr:hypothetical protein [Thermodesulfobacteriota bacterium]
MVEGRFWVKGIIINLFIIAFLFQTGMVMESYASGDDHFSEAQDLIDKTVAKYLNIVRLTIHAVPAGKEGSRIIACNIKEKIGSFSDPEDLEVLKTNKAVILKEEDNLDVTAPICDKAGRPIAATGITLRFRKGETESQVVEKAKSIAKELTAAIQNSNTPLW